MVFLPLFLKVFAGGPHLSEEIGIWTWHNVISGLMKVVIFLFSARETPPWLTLQLFYTVWHEGHKSPYAVLIISVTGPLSN